MWPALGASHFCFFDVCNGYPRKRQGLQLSTNTSLKSPSPGGASAASPKFKGVAGSEQIMGGPHCNPSESRIFARIFSRRERGEAQRNHRKEDQQLILSPRPLRGLARLRR